MSIADRMDYLATTIEREKRRADATCAAIRRAANDEAQAVMARLNADLAPLLVEYAALQRQQDADADHAPTVLLVRHKAGKRQRLNAALKRAVG